MENSKVNHFSVQRTQLKHFGEDQNLLFHLYVEAQIVQAVAKSLSQLLYCAWWLIVLYVSYSLYLKKNANIMHTYTLVCCYIVVYLKTKFPYCQLGKTGIYAAVSTLWSSTIRVPAYMFLEKRAECYTQIEVSRRFLHCK